jgi:hypothetical protein
MRERAARTGLRTNLCTQAGGNRGEVVSSPPASIDLEKKFHSNVI